MRRSQDGCCTLGFAMERVGILLGVFVWCNVAAQSMAHNEDSAFSRVFPSLFEDAAPFQFKNDFVPYLHDLTFSSWPTQISEFRMLEDWPPIPRVPRVEVSCDNSRLTVLVWKDLSGVTLTADEVQLGDGCYRTAELPNQLVFSYNVDECGTSHVVSWHILTSITLPLSSECLLTLESAFTDAEWLGEFYQLSPHSWLGQCLVESPFHCRHHLCHQQVHLEFSEQLSVILIK